MKVVPKATRLLSKTLPKLSFELLAEDDVNEEVDAAVDGDEEVGDLGDMANLTFHGLKDVNNERQNVTNEKDNHDNHQHDG